MSAVLPVRGAAPADALVGVASPDGLATPTATATLDLSVVMPTYRRPDLLARCLGALLAQTLPADRFEVIVVDDGQEDRCREQVERVAATPGAPAIRYLRAASGRGPAVARNAGWRAATAPLVAFTDDDTLPDPSWLARGLAAMQAHPDWVAAAGQVRVPSASAGGIGTATDGDGDGDIGRDGAPARRDARPTDHELMTRGLETSEFVTANAFARREVLARIEGFDERFLRAWREDSDLQFRLQAQGPVGRVADALVWHPVRPERWGVSLRQQRNVYFDALLYRKHPAIYRSRIRRVPPWDYYAIVAMTPAALVLAVAGEDAIAAGLLAASAALILRLTAHRLRATSRALPHVWEMLCTSAAIPFLSVYWRLRGAWHFRTPFL
ncbi:GT2 family glycosyltransferase [Mitsuaria sp. BK045]|uniref:glycosyltransferase family 2 protein n=1 Tax=unclassified Roseateles TaxID=2626991 RepID=UPI00160BBB43|nr:MULTISPECIES: glycosyltransferase [unclassified Roseateles]MBB3293250.1 GT2 family glycosyltransferase [Mitsuaria sp. BK041]MBB3362467.1 GT2 family glycosyltransferase [Mitsuaria sp. BK045]